MLINGANLRTLQQGFNTLFGNAFTEAQSDFDKVAMTVNSTGSSENYGWMNKTTQFREWLGDRVIQNLSSSDYLIKNRPFENTVGVDRDDIEDDKYGVYSPLFQQLGQDAKCHPDTLIFELLKNGFTNACFDGQYFFDTDHPVAGAAVSNHGGGSSTPWFLLDTSKAIRPLIFQKRRDYQFVAMDQVNDEQVFSQKLYRYGTDARVNAGYGLWQMAYGSKQVLDETSYAAARTAMASLKGENGKPLNVRGTLLVVPPSLEMAALKLLNAEMTGGGNTNILRGTASLLVTPWVM